VGRPPAGEKLMKKRKEVPLKDEWTQVYNGELDALKNELSQRYETMSDKILKKKRKEFSTSVPAMSGGRPESNRRKF
jgi:hypothetical protein